MYPKVFLKKDRAKNIIQGHPWVFSNAIQSMETVDNGGLVEVYSKDLFIGIGYYNASTDIAIRMMTARKEPVDRDFFRQRFIHLKDQKEPWVMHTNAYRICFGESDGLPGLIADIFDRSIVVQFHTLGMERMKDQITRALVEVFDPACIYARTMIHSRAKEGLPLKSEELLYGAIPGEIVIQEHGFKFLIDIVKGQKTGFFIDQRENRYSVIRYVSGRRVLDCFCNTGGFSIYAGSSASQVTSVDISKGAMDAVRRNIALNGYDPGRFTLVCSDVFEYLKTADPGAFDVIILDPPSFAHKRTQVKNAIKAYTTINSKALEKLHSGGMLISASCTAHIDELTFIKILHQSAVNARCQVKVMHSSVQPFDHPYNLHFPEGRYLKFFILMKD